MQSSAVLETFGTKRNAQMNSRELKLNLPELSLNALLTVNEPTYENNWT